MDIFSFTKRGKQDSIKRPLNFPSYQITQKKLQQDHRVETEQFKLYLKNLYMKFDYKINRCNSKCISDAKSYKEVRECEIKCSEGVTKFSGYIDSRVTEMQQLLGDCVSNASNLHNAMDEIYYCYQIYNSSFKKLKQFITEESMYYE